MRNLILEGLKSGRLQLQGLESEDLPQAGKMRVQADMLGLPGAAAQVEKLVSRLSREKGVSAIRWQLGEMALA